jgi:predicted N-acetyltransferase YhbS
MVIRNMEKADINEVLAVAESAFFDEKLYKWAVLNNSERGAFIKGFFQFRLEAGFGTRFMKVAIDDSKKIIGAAIWIPPVEDKVKGDSSNFEKFLSKFNNDVRDRCNKFINTVKEAENSFFRPHWTLAPVFIHKEMQGKGVASLLIRKQLETIDNEHLPCILVTQEENNIPIYERYGFKVTIELPIDTGIMSYGMIRG